MKKRVTDPNLMLELQGDIVLVIMDGEEILFTIVQIVDIGHRELELADRFRSAKERLSPMPLTQAVFDNLVPVKHERAKWKLEL